MRVPSNIVLKELEIDLIELKIRLNDKLKFGEIKRDYFNLKISIQEQLINDLKKKIDAESNCQVGLF